MHLHLLLMQPYQLFLLLLVVVQQAAAGSLPTQLRCQQQQWQRSWQQQQLRPLQVQTSPGRR
jgi:hypothetical protein